jgi:hypothetical protein
MNDSSNRYYVKNTENGTFQDITTMFNGVAVLKISGFLDKGKPVNIYTEQWIDNQEEDFLITTTENNVPVVIRENTDLELTFIIRQKYATSTINLMTVHDNFINYMTGSDVWLKSAYVGNKYVHCVCLKEYNPTAINLERGDKSYIMGTITMHTLNSPTV